MGAAGGYSRGPMPVFACNVCGTSLTAGDEHVGRQVRCPTCQSIQTVPGERSAGGDVPIAARTGREAAGGGGTTTTTATAPPPPRPRASAGLSSDTLAAFKPEYRRGLGGRRYGFNCQYCSSRLEATEDKAGQEGQCPTCGNAIVIPILDRYGRLIDPMTGKVIKQDPHPVHAYAAAGERAPRIVRDGNKQAIKCAKCGTVNPITGNNCKSCGMPFTMEGTTLEAAGASNGFCVASLVLGIIGIPAFCTVVVPLLAIVFGLIGLAQGGEGGGKGMAIGGIVCGGVGLLILVAWML